MRKEQITIDNSRRFSLQYVKIKQCVYGNLRIIEKINKRTSFQYCVYVYLGTSSYTFCRLFLIPKTCLQYSQSIFFDSRNVRVKIK